MANAAMPVTYRSPHRQPHPSFPQPDDGAVQVWRYMDLPRLISLLTREELILTRADLMMDRFEGAIPEHVFRKWSATPERQHELTELRAQMRAGVYISSWHENRRESEAMWRLFCGAGEGVALSTTYAKLDAALAACPDAQIGRVTYVDYQGEGWQDAYLNALTPFMLKRASFEHEREIRVLQRRPLDAEPSEPPPAIGLKWTIADAVDQVWVSPYAERWYFDVVQTVLRHFAPALAPRLTWSEMTASPWF
jgi:hypothetical protein